MPDVEKKEFEELQDNVREILGYIRDDPYTGRKGLYSQLRDLHDRVEVLEMDKKIKLAQKAILVFIGGIIATVLGAIYKILF